MSLRLQALIYIAETKSEVLLNMWHRNKGFLHLVPRVLLLLRAMPIASAYYVIDDTSIQHVPQPSTGVAVRKILQRFSFCL
jgi:hypothetical protein